MTQPRFRPKDESLEEVERARLAAVEALRRLEGEDQHGELRRPGFRPKDESPEEVERARLAAVEALRRLEGEDQLGELRRAPSRRSGSAERQSGVKYISWDTGNKAWRVKHTIQNGPDKGCTKHAYFRPKDDRRRRWSGRGSPPSRRCGGSRGRTSSESSGGPLLDAAAARSARAASSTSSGAKVARLGLFSTGYRTARTKVA
ncbi:unnamed protein product [Prorocentrum cordatum]|uniref:AP2/ERF domain-containing protein n=1 Tax=Prorocentrum cordatum TaxID=2364126 RepID=A0ABN9T6J3_9DINO|nr:unnamed protein product [Polarella glacialis]